MLQLREDQIDVLQGLRERRFVERLESHLRFFFPSECAALEGDLVDTITFGVRRARAHSFDSERDVVKYLNLMFVFGRGFDSPPPPWAEEGLNGAGDQRRRMRALYRAALRHEDEGRGPLGAMHEGTTDA